MTCMCGCGTEAKPGNRFITGHNRKFMVRWKVPIADRFWPRVSRPAPDACWLWQGAVNKSSGYGLIDDEHRKSKSTHRIAWELTHGAVPDGLCVLHRCDVKTCVNPAHLFLGTRKDNTHDAMAKGRHTRGSQINGKLSEADIRSIRESSEPKAVLAGRFNVTATAIGYIQRRKVWAHVA